MSKVSKRVKTSEEKRSEGEDRTGVADVLSKGQGSKTKDETKQGHTYGARDDWRHCVGMPRDTEETRKGLTHG